MAKKLIQIDKGVYKLMVEVDYDELSTEIPEIGEGIAKTIADAVEKAKEKEESKRKKKGGG